MNESWEVEKPEIIHIVDQCQDLIYVFFVFSVMSHIKNCNFEWVLVWSIPKHDWKYNPVLFHWYRKDAVFVTKICSGSFVTNQSVVNHPWWTIVSW